MPTQRTDNSQSGPNSRYDAPPTTLPGWPDDDPLVQALAETAGPTHWPSLAQKDLPQAWQDLRDWVDQLSDRFAVDVRTIPPCWEQHNGMVEALSALRDYERGCYADTASPTAAVDFIRALREIQLCLRESAAQTQCSIKEHRPDPPRSTAHQPLHAHPKPPPPSLEVESYESESR